MRTVPCQKSDFFIKSLNQSTNQQNIQREEMPEEEEEQLQMKTVDSNI